MKALSKPLLLKLYFLLAALESAAVFFLLVSTPSAAGSAVFWGFSWSRLVLLTAALGLFSLSAFFLFSKRAALFAEQIFSSRWRLAASLASASLLFAATLVWLTPPERLAGYAAAVERLAPLVYLGGAVGLQTLALLFFGRGQAWDWNLSEEWKKVFVLTGAGLGVLVAFSAWVSWTGIGILPEKYGWHFPGTPLVFFQAFLAWLAALPFVVWDSAIARFEGKFPRLRLDAALCLILWLVAVFLWWGEPMRKESYFTPTPVPPNFEYYPYSDAANYDLSAQNMLIGAVESNETVIRPLYVLFLTVAHLLGGQRYENVIFMQTLLAAFIPVLAYLLAAMFGGRPAGVLIATLLLLREKNSIALTNVIEVSHVKLYMSDVLTTALMLLLVYLLFKWLRDASNAALPGILAGASFGTLMLMRSHQSLVVIPALALGMAFSGGFEWRRALRRFSLFALGLALVVSPWVWRNYRVSGNPAIENSNFYIGWYAGAYTEPTDTVEMLPGETPEAYSARIKSQVFRYILNHPLELSRVYASYFIRNEIDSVLALPMSPRLYDLRLYISRLPYWKDPVVGFNLETGLAFWVTLGLMTLGVAVSVQRLGWMGFLPLLVHFSYNFSMSLARISGWRFVQPVDWILFMYYAAGAAALMTIALALIRGGRAALFPTAEKAPAPFNVKLHGLGLALFLLLGVSLPLLEAFIPRRYPDLNDGQLAATYAADGFSLENGERLAAEDLTAFLASDPDAVILRGRALFPLFYEQDKYWGSENSFTRRARQFDRLQFNYIGSNNTLVFLPLDAPPAYFPNAADVLIVGCRERSGVRALAVQVNDRAPLAAAPWQGLTCR